MLEREWWSRHVKPRWHNPAEGRVAWKVEDAFNGGKPDVDFVFRGVSGKCELKYISAWPSRDDKLITFSRDSELNQNKVVSPGQYNHLDEWQRGGGLSFVFIGVDKEWFLFSFTEFQDGLNDGIKKADFYKLSLFYGDSYNSIAWVPQFIIDNYGQR